MNFVEGVMTITRSSCCKPPRSKPLAKHAVQYRISSNESVWVVSSASIINGLVQADGLLTGTGLSNRCEMISWLFMMLCEEGIV